MLIIEESSDPCAWRTVESMVGAVTVCRDAGRVEAAVSDPARVAVTAFPLDRAGALALQRALHARHPRLHVVFVSPSGDPASVAEAFAAGATDHCTSPWTPDELAARLRAGRTEASRTDGEHTRIVTAARPWRALADTVHGSLEAMIGGSLVREEGDSIDDQVAFATTITLVEAALGVEIGIGLVASRDAARACALLMLGEDGDDAVIADLVGELANIAAGAIKSAMAPAKVKLVLRIPKRESAASIASAARGFSERQSCRMVIGGGGLRLWAGVRWRGTRQVKMCNLLENMVLAEDIRSALGALVIAGGTRLTSTMAERLAGSTPNAQVGVCVV